MRSILPFVFVLTIGISPAIGQENDRYTLVMRGVPLGQALEQLAYTTGMDLVYTSVDVEGKQSFCNGRHLPPTELLSCVLKGSNLDFVRSSSGAYVLIDAVAAAPRFGHLAGSITDAETGEPLPYANVLLADAATGTSTNEAGLFSFASLLTGPHRIVVTYVGYETATDSIWIDPGKQRRIQIALQSAESTLAPLVINGLTQRLPSSGLGRGDQTSEHLRSTSPTGTADITRGLTAITGVAVQQPIADLHIQGGSAGEHVTLLDGVPVRDPVNMGRYLSAFSPLALGRITVHKAGFGAHAGSNLAGVVDVTHDISSVGDDRISLSIDPISINGRAEGRFRLENGQEGAAMAAVRGGVWSAYRDPAVTSLLESWHAVDPLFSPSSFARDPTNDESVFTVRSPDVQFSDLHGALRLNLSNYRTLHASAYRARNRMVSDFASSRSSTVEEAGHLMLTRDEYDWTNWIGQIRHSWLLGARATFSTQIAGSWNDSRYGYFGLYDTTGALASIDELKRASDAHRSELETYPSADEDNHIRELSWRTTFSYSISAGHQVDADLSTTHAKSHFLFENGLITPIAHSGDAWLVAGSVEGRHHFGLGTVVEPGVRLTYLPNRNSVYAEPRLAVRHDAPAGRFGSLALRVAGGLYRQFVNQLDVTNSGATSLIPTSLVWLPLDGSLAPPRALHVATEALLMPDPNWTISIEAFRKWQQRLLVFDYASIADREMSVHLTSQRQFVTAASGHVQGASLRVERDGGPVHPIVTYSYVQAKRRYSNRFDGTLQPVPWNTPHRITADVSTDLFHGIRALANWEAGWGRKWALRRSYYDYIAYDQSAPSVAPFDLHDPSSSGVPAYYRLDAGMSFRTQWDTFDAELRLFVTNVTNRRNVYDLSLQPGVDGFESVPRMLPGRHVFFSAILSY